MPLPTSVELANQLLRAAQARAQQHGLVFDSLAEDELRNMADYGARNILGAAQTKSAVIQDQYVRGTVRVASEAMMTIVDEMTSARHRLPGYAIAQNILDAQTLKAARDIFCPIWPIC
jgi:hypothetical protein